MEKIDRNNEAMEGQGNSSMSIKLWLPNDDSSGGRYWGEIFVDQGQLVVNGARPEDEKFLENRIRNLWFPQLGVPKLSSDKNGFIRGTDGVIVVSKYLNYENSSPDELIDALYQLIHLAGVNKVLLATRN
jgi:hypothetical protein